jgi:hypothetical protein
MDREIFYEYFETLTADQKSEFCVKVKAEFKKELNKINGPFPVNSEELDFIVNYYWAHLWISGVEANKRALDPKFFVDDILEKILIDTIEPEEDSPDLKHPFSPILKQS